MINERTSYDQLAPYVLGPLTRRVSININAVDNPSTRTSEKLLYGVGNERATPFPQEFLVEPFPWFHDMNV